jgi:hypothetical protein
MVTVISAGHLEMRSMILDGAGWALELWKNSNRTLDYHVQWY